MDRGELILKTLLAHGPDFGHRETYCDGCGAPTGDWGRDYEEHVADMIDAALEQHELTAV